MSIPYDATGRTKQKSRTRQALVAAVRQLLREGTTPSVEEAAETAGISRTTAYRYFPTQRDLLVAAQPMIETESLLGENPPEDPETRLGLVLDGIERLTRQNTAELRTALRLSLEPEADRSQLVLRQGRAIGWIHDALCPLGARLSEKEVHRLVLAIRATFGIEACVWLTDVAGLSVEEAFALMRDSAMTLLRSATTASADGSRGDRSPAPRSRTATIRPRPGARR